MPLPASLVALGSPVLSLLSVTVVPAALVLRGPSLSGDFHVLCMCFGIPRNAATAQPHSPFLRGFVILSFSSTTTQAVKRSGAELGVPMSVRGYVATSSSP